MTTSSSVALAGLGSDRCRPFTDAPGEDERVEPTEDGCVGPDLCPHPMAEDRDRERGAWIGRTRIEKRAQLVEHVGVDEDG